MYKITPAMDIFSLGAVIAELFLEDMLFDYSKLLKYKKGEFNLEQVLKEKFKDKKLEKLEYILLKMMKVNPNERIDLSSCFKYFAEDISPITFPRMLLHFNTLIVSFDYWKPDKKIGLIYKHWKQIWKILYSPESEVPELYQNLNHQILNKIILDKPFQKYIIENYPVLFDLDDDNLLSDEDDISLDKFKEKDNSDCALIIVNYILSSILQTKFASSKIVGMEILRIFSTKITALNKIQTIVPYLIKLLKDTSNLVRYTALHEIIEILSGIDDIILPTSDYNFFDSYVFPSILELYNSNEPSLTVAFANIIDKLCDLEQKFLQITMRSRFENLKHQHFSTSSSSNVIRQQQQSLYFPNQQQGGNKGEDIILAYDSDLSEFKSTLFKIIEDILSKNEELDIQQTLIRKLPNLMLFFGRRETNNFSKFIIAHFNKKDWLIQREILKCIPSLIVTLGETSLNQFIVPCMELIINNNLNELKIYEMIHSMHLLLKMEFLETFRGIDLFKKILPYIMHPNLWIRNEVISFANTLINLLSPGEVYTYLRPELKQYLYMPFLIISTELIKKATKSQLSRVIYELECKSIQYHFKRNEQDEEAFQILQKILEYGKESMKYNSQSEDSTQSPVKLLEGKISRIKAILEGISISYMLKKEFNKFTKQYTSDDIKFLERTFLGKLVSLSSIMHTYSLPSSRNRRISLDLNQFTDNIVAQENFKLKYLFKALDIVIKEELMEILDIDMNKESQNIKSSTQSINLNSNKSSNISFMHSWKPQGKLLNTLYDHNNSPLEKLLPINISNQNYTNPENVSKFMSFSSDGNMILWDLISNEHDISVEKVCQAKTYNNLNISYNKALCNVDNNQFAISTKHIIELYRVSSIFLNVLFLF
jgi:phosphoinositide-3-kinase regulatory subunit 4